MDNIKWESFSIDRTDHESLNRHKSFTIWLTGLSGSGKSTLARELEEILFNLGCNTVILDGDNIRHGLSSDLSFNEKDRKENLRRIREVCKLFIESGKIVICAFICPYESDRKVIRDDLGDDYIEVFCNCPLDVCESRDVKGLYKKAKEGIIKHFTGITSPYEDPNEPDIILDSSKSTPNEDANAILNFLIQNNRLFLDGTI